ncbi:MAG: molybdopterin-dependent oxidoreductase, partial [Bacillota bacterium]
MELFRPVVTDATVKTACGLCHMACGMEVVMENGRLAKVRGMREHPYKGFLCPKGRAVAEYVFSPKRLTTPLLRQGSGWKEISWQEAMQLIVDRLESIRETGDARSLAFAIGMPILLSGTLTVGLIRRFAHVFGTPNCFSVESICYRCRMLGYITTLGQFFVADPENAACIIVWGSNPDNSSPPLGVKIRESRRKGAKLVVIDPRRTPLAALAEEHLQPLPGTD